MLGIPAIAISQQSGRREMDFHLGRDFDFSVAAAFAAQLVERVAREPLPADTLINVNCPAGTPSGIEVTHLGKRLYNDELKLVEEDPDSGRRRYQIYGFEPSFEDEEGSDLSAIANGRIAVTPVHFDLTDHSGLRPLARLGLRRDAGGRPPMAAPAAAKKQERSSCARRSQSTIGSTTSETIRRSRTPSTTTCSASCARSRRPTPSWSRPTRPTQRVGGAPLEKFGHVTHAEPMLSLGNARNEDELRAWAERVERQLERLDISGRQIRYVTEPKVDGLAISLTYEDGGFTRGATRGDGRVGEDVTQNLRTIDAIPKKITDAPELVEVRGEVYLPIAAFAELNAQRAEAGEPTFANPRNSAAGSLRQLDPRITASRPLSLWTYGIGARGGWEPDSHSEMLEWLRERGFPVNDQVKTHKGVDEVAKRCRWWEDRRDQLDFEIDGVVVKVDDRGLQRELGVAGREPRWAVAWKFPPSTATTKLNKIVWNVGRTGHLLPFAMLEPVHVSGVTVSTATLHNEEDLERKDVREGDEVVVLRAGDVIPQVVSPVIQKRKGRRLRKAKPPKKCPLCGTATVKPGDGVFTICPNRAGCPGQQFQLIKHFRGALRSRAWARRTRCASCRRV